MLTTALAIFVGVGLVFFALAKLNARPGFNALALGLFLAATPLFSPHVPLPPGAWRDVATVIAFLVVASLGTALGGGLKPRDDDHSHEPHEH